MILRGLLKAGLISDLLTAALATAVLTAFGHWYAGDTTGDMVQRVLLWFPISALVMAPLSFVIFPLIGAALAKAGRASALVLAVTGGVIGLAIGAYALWRFRDVLFQSSFVAAPLVLLLAFWTAFAGGFIFDLAARRALAALADRSDAPEIAR